MQLELKLKDQKNRETASDLYYSVQHIYKDWDYRCLVPYSHKDPTKWKTYDMPVSYTHLTLPTILLV